MFLERRHLPRDRRLRHAHLTCDRGERAGFGHADVDAKCGEQVHDLCLSHIKLTDVSGL